MKYIILFLNLVVQRHRLGWELKSEGIFNKKNQGIINMAGAGKDSDSDSDSETPLCSLKPILMPYVFPSYVASLM